MIPYGNRSGKSGVTAYQCDTGSITVKFINGDTYLYTVASAGAVNINKMQLLAGQGEGLSTYISTSVKNKYERKL